MKVPYIDKFTINNLAAGFRRKNWGDLLPVNIEEIITYKLKIDIIPERDLQKLCNSDAFITADWKNVYVDSDNYMDDRQYNRLRFSLAHEIGHFVLHKELFESFGLKNLPDFYQFIDDLGDDYGIIEGHANKFANCLLVPKDKLKQEKETVEQRLYAEYPELAGVDDATMNSYISAPLAKIFEVSQQVAEISLSDLKDFN